MAPSPRTLARSPLVALAVLLLGVYGYFYQAGGWNQNSRFDLVRAVVEDHALTIDRFEKNTGDDSIRNGRYYCDKAPGASLLCLPTYAAVYAGLGSPKVVSPGALAWAAWLSIFVAVGIPSAVAATFLVRLSRRLGLSDTGALAVGLGWALGSMALPYATLLYGNQLAAAFTIIAFAMLVQAKDEAASPRRRLVIGALLGFSIACEYPAALVVFGVGLYSLFALGVRRSIWVMVGGAIPIAVLLGYHWAAFGSPAAFPYDYSVWHEPKTGWFMGISKPVWSSLAKILTGEHRGLLWQSPWLGLAPIGAVVLARARLAEVLVAAWAVFSFLWLNASIPPWHGGWAAGPRYLVPMLPFAALLAGGVFLEIERAARGARIALAIAVLGLMVLSGANMFAATAVKPEIPTAIVKPYSGFVWPKLRAGELSVSTQSIDMIDNPPGAPRQAWNLGMKLGLTGLTSLAPLFGWVTVTGLWLAWATWRERSRPFVLQTRDTGEP